MEQDRLEIIAAMNTKIITNGINQTVAAVKGLENAQARVNARFNELGQLKGFSVVTNNVKNVSNETKNLSTNVAKVSSILNKSFNFGKLYLLWNITKRIRTSIWGCVEASIDFIETTNKFEVSMRSMADEAYNFQDRLSNAFGLARADMMEFQATYMNIMSALPRINRRSF